MATKIFWLGDNPAMISEFNAELDALFADGYEVKIATNVMIVLYKGEPKVIQQFVEVNPELSEEQIRETFGNSLREIVHAREPRMVTRSMDGTTREFFSTMYADYIAEENDSTH